MKFQEIEDGSLLNLRIVPKRQKDVSAIEGKVLAMYARGMYNAIYLKLLKYYGFSVSHEINI